MLALTNGLLQDALRNILPPGLQVPAKYWYRWARRTLQLEMQILSRIVQPGEHVVDVGGNRGVYAFKLWSLGCKVEVFEPNPACCKILQACGRDKERMHVHRVALSSGNGEASLLIPMDADCMEHDASASLEHGFTTSRAEIVSTRTLDSFGYEDVSLIKIDVEGHECCVLACAAGTLRLCAPALLVEIEQRHKMQLIEQIFDSLHDQGYGGYLLEPGMGDLLELCVFSVDRD
jgi:FkbM family methyltransferase